MQESLSRCSIPLSTTNKLRRAADKVEPTNNLYYHKTYYPHKGASLMPSI